MPGDDSSNEETKTGQKTELRLEAGKDTIKPALDKLQEAARVTLSEFKSALSLMSPQNLTGLADLEIKDDESLKAQDGARENPQNSGIEKAKQEAAEYEEYKKALKTPLSERTGAQNELIDKVRSGRATQEQFIANPIDLNASPEEKVEQLVKLSKENQDLVKRTAESLHEKFGSKIPQADKTWGHKAPVDIRLKSEREEITQKKPWFGVEHIRDAIRFRTVIEDIKDLPKIVEELKSQGFEIIKPDPEKLVNTRDLKLRMAPFDLRAPNGQIIEYYVLPREQFEAMTGGHHDIYKKWRERKVETLSEAEKLERERDFAKARQMADDKWEAYLKRTGQTQEDVNEVVRKVREIIDTDRTKAEQRSKDNSKNSDNAEKDLASKLAESESFKKLSDEKRMTEALKQLTDRTLQRLPEGNEAKGEFLERQIRAAMRRQLGVSTDAELPESVRKMQIKIVDTDAASPKIIQANSGEAAVFEIPAKVLLANPKSVLVDAYAQASGLGLIDALHETGNEAIVSKAIEPFLKQITQQAEKIVGERSLALAVQEKPLVNQQSAASDREIKIDFNKPLLTSWDGENLTFGTEKYQLRSELAKIETEKGERIKELERDLQKAKELAEASKKTEDMGKARDLALQLEAEKQNLKVVSELHLAMKGERGQAAREKAGSLVKTAADRALNERFKPGEGGSNSLSRGAAIAMIVSTLAFMYVSGSKSAQADNYDGAFKIH